MELKSGDSSDPAGVLPVHWPVVPLRELAQVRSGVAKNSNTTFSDPILVHYLRVANVQDGFLDLREVSKIEINRNELNRFSVLPGDVLMNEGGDLDKLGRGSIWSGELAPCIHQNHVFVVRCGPRLSPEYLNTWSSSVAARRYFMVAGKQTTNLASINKTALGGLPVAVPPLPEQKAIAAALSDVDALLVALDRLIDKKRDLKQAAMQQLLTGQTRLPGFSGKWEDTTIGTLGSWFSGGTPSKGNETYWTGDIPWVSPKDMKRARILDAIDHVGQSAIGNGTRLLPTGAILIVVRGMILAHSAPVARVERAVAFNQDIKGLVVRSGIDSNFVLWWLVAHEALLLSLTNEATHGTKRIPTNELLKLRLRVPLLEEQAAIAGVISDMDAELTALEQRRDKTRLLKQGMMQELLTGRTRLV